MSEQKASQDPPIVNDLLPELTAGLAQAGLSKAQVDDMLPEIRLEMIEASKTTPAPDQGGPKVIVGEDVFVGLEDTGGKILESGLKLALCAILAGHGHVDPQHAKGALVDLLVGLRKTVMKLDDTQKLVCLAILEISRAKRYKVFIEPGASAAEITAYFTGRSETVPEDLPKVLERLAGSDPKVLENATYGDRGPFYQVRF
jgi:hypothetical protein